MITNFINLRDGLGSYSTNAQNQEVYQIPTNMEGFDTCLTF